MVTDRQREAFDELRKRNRDRANALLEHVCDLCKDVFVGRRDDARELGWRKRWLPKGGIRVQVDVCPACRRTR